MTDTINLYREHPLSSISVFEDDGDSGLILFPDCIMTIDSFSPEAAAKAESFGRTLYKEASESCGSNICIRSPLNGKSSLLQAIYLLVDCTSWLSNQQTDVCCKDFQELFPKHLLKSFGKVRKRITLSTGSVVSILSGIADAHRSGLNSGPELTADCYEDHPCHTVLAGTILLELFSFRKVRVVRNQVQGPTSSTALTEPVLVTTSQTTEEMSCPLCTSIDLPLKDAYGSLSASLENFGFTPPQLTEACSGSVIDGLPLLCSPATVVNADLVTTTRAKVQLYNVSAEAAVNLQSPVTMLFLKDTVPKGTKLVWHTPNDLPERAAQEVESDSQAYDKSGEAIEKILRTVFGREKPVADGTPPPVFQLVANVIDVDNLYVVIPAERKRKRARSSQNPNAAENTGAMDEG